MSKDRVFATPIPQIKNFTFDESIAKVFDDMVSRSVPFYHEIHRIILDLVDRTYPKKGTVYDLGCSTGTTMLMIDQHLKKQGKNVRLIGVDNSSAMLEECDKKLKKKVREYRLDCADLTDYHFEKADMIIMNYTLQFISPQKRNQLLKDIYKALKPGGIFLLSEKIKTNRRSVHNLLTNLYYDFKKRNGYSKLEIAQKREALENVLIPLTPEKQLQLMEESGFKKHDMLFRWYNFACFIGIK